ncbi:unnamed protein product [Sphacelaria rigidula]
MPGQRREIERKLEKLPESFTAEEIENMYKKLVADIALLEQQEVPQKVAEAELHKRHQTSAYSYPTIFFKAVRGEMDQHIFDTLIKLKRKFDSGEIDDKRAKELVIDGAKRHVEGEAPRAPKSAPKQGGSVQEITLKCRVEDEESKP